MLVYMRDNHTFRFLAQVPGEAIAQVMYEWDANWKSGSVFYRPGHRGPHQSLHLSFQMSRNAVLEKLSKWLRALFDIPSDEDIWIPQDLALKYTSPDVPVQYANKGDPNYAYLQMVAQHIWIKTRWVENKSEAIDAALKD